MTGPWRAFQRQSLALRLAVLSAGLAALVTAATFTALSIQLQHTTRSLFASQLARNGRTLVSLQRQSRKQLLVTASLLAESPTLRSAIATYRVEAQAGSAQRADLTATVEHELQRLGSGLPGNVLLATDERGRVFASYERGDSSSLRGSDLAQLPAVHNALDAQLESNSDEPYLSGLEAGGRYYDVAAAPLILDGFAVGTIVFGERVDSSLVASLRRDFSGEIVISAGKSVIGSTLPRVGAERALATPDDSQGVISVGAQEYLAAMIPLGVTQHRTALKITLLQPLTPTVQALRTSLLRDFALYGTLAVIIAALGGALLSRSTLRPLVGFIRFLRRGADAQGISMPHDARDASREVRVLSSSFNDLMRLLNGERIELEQRSAQLSAANEVLTDEIRERERVERALRESEAQLRQSQKLEAVGTLAGGIAHDFNNMLTVISGFTQLSMERLGKGHEVNEDLKQVSDAATSAAALTQQLLAFSRKQVLQPRVLDLESIVHGMEGMLRRLIGSHVHLDVEHVGEPARIKADPGQLEQVLLNLVVNARDAMPSGGVLTIQTSHRKNAAAGEQVSLRVSDTGCGMPADVRDRVFEPFYTTKESGKGTGLGLSTVYGIVAQSGGAIDIESVVGKGSTFTVLLPTAVEAVTPSACDHDDASRYCGTETILVVDDEAAVLELSRRALTACGYTVFTATNGVDALSFARGERHVDAILTDVVMPQLSGPQLIERYRAKHATTVFIYMTGFVDDTTMRLELDGEVALLRKPFSSVDVVRTVRSALDARCPSLTLSRAS